MSYRREDFDPPNRMNGPFVFLLCCLGLVATNAISFYAGMETNAAIQREAKRVEDAKPKKAQAPMANPLLQWNCTTQEFREHLHACKGRERAGRVVGG